MKRKIRCFTPIIVLVMLTSSCVYFDAVSGNGNVVEQSRKVAEFDKISVSRGMNVYISQGKSQKIKVEADENLLDVIETKVEKNTLKITSSKNIIKSRAKKVYITAPHVEEIKASAGANVFSESTLGYKNLKLACSAGSNMKLAVKTENLEISASAGSNISIKGIAEEFQGSASSGANIRAGELKATNCNAKVSSGANIWITPENEFRGNASSGGNIFYHGNPKSTEVKNSSGGNVIQK